MDSSSRIKDPHSSTHGEEHDTTKKAPNDSLTSSRLDSITSLDKNLDRTFLMPDHNDYDLWDAVMTITKSIILANPHINDDEVLSVNYKGGPIAPSATSVALSTYQQKERETLAQQGAHF